MKYFREHRLHSLRKKSVFAMGSLVMTTQRKNEKRCVLTMDSLMMTTQGENEKKRRPRRQLGDGDFVYFHVCFPSPLG